MLPIAGMPRILSPLLCSLLLLPTLLLAAPPYQSTGFRTGEMAHDSAVVWTRTTLREKSNPADGISPIFVLKDGERFVPDINTKNKPEKNVDPVSVEYPDGSGFEDIRYGAPGMEGEVRVLYRPAGTDAWEETEWRKTSADQDFIQQFKLNGLQAGTRYELQVETRSLDGEAGQTLTGGLDTAPASDQPAKVVFTVSTGQAFWDLDRKDGFQIYPTMLEKTQPHFFVHTGDIVYYDMLAKNLDLARWHWHRTYSLPTNVEFHRQVGTYFIKDDHDTWTNDAWSTMKSNMGSFTWDQGIVTFLEQTPVNEPTFRRQRWGKDLEVWMVEGRDFRSANNMQDGPEKTIWGDKQKLWVKQTMQESDATFRVLISPTPIVGPDRNNKRDNHANTGFQTEGDEVRAFLSSLDNTFVVCGDRHWQYHSIHPETGIKEYSCGPASNEHAGGWRQSDYRDDYHQFLRVKGGYLSVTCERENDQPRLIFRFHSVDGDVEYENIQTAD